MSYYETFNTLLGLGLNALILNALLRGIWRDLPLLFAYMTIGMVATLGTLLIRLDGGWSAGAVEFYWISELVGRVALFSFLVHMLSKVVRGREGKARLAYFVAGGLVFTGLSLWQAYDARLSYWMTQFVRNISFGSMFVNLTLWTLLLRNPNRPYLMIAAGIGLEFAGSAIGHSLRQISRSTVGFGNVVIVTSSLLSLYIIWYALKTMLIRLPQESKAMA